VATIQPSVAPDFHYLPTVPPQSLHPSPGLAAPHLSLLLVIGIGSIAAACGGAAATAAPPKTDVTDREVAEAAIAQGGFNAAAGGDGASSKPMLAATLKADLLGADEKVKMDGVLGEWPARTRADTFIQGAADPSFGFTAGLRYDASFIYFGGEVTTAAFKRTSRFGDDEDHASLILAFGAGGASAATYEVRFFAGKPGETAGQVRFGSGRGTVAGAEIVEAPMTGGYSFEAKVPWSAFPEARTIRVGLRGAARYYEGRSRIVATGPGDARHPDDLPPIPTDPEQSLDEGFLAEHNLRGKSPSFDILADVAGDAMKERIQVWGSLLTVCGPGYRGGKDYFYRDLGGPVVRLEARALTGRGKDDLTLVRRVEDSGVKRDWFEVLSFLRTDDPARTFGQEIAVVQGGQRVENEVHAVAGRIDVSILPAKGWDASSYRVPLAADVAPILLPWGTVKSQQFKWDGALFTKVHEVTQPGQPGGSAPAAMVPRLPSDPGAVRATVAARAPVTTTVDAAAILAQYRRDHAATADARFELSADLDGDGRADHVVLIDRDLVVSGPEIGDGHGYTYLTLQPFAAGTDIQNVTVRDLAGASAGSGVGAMIIVRGTRHVSASHGATVDEEVLLIYALRSGALTRVFAIETARAQGPKRIQGLVQFIPARSGRGFDIDVRPGRATGWTQASFPWQEDPPGGSMEPLLLPWGASHALRYAWDGAKFSPP
jgi:hypothetical protein